ncbi:helix-turn-helix transcriptional regulator [Fusobacterium necrophorum]|uniref:helix-turn-helix domain-containing protein n=1 Tax=Fusobacterium necrophorum TaxID=859 RepID=UPI00254CB424|nr:helix-turn-helix transcriptional regulator [Fusobacterium necrophorum]MDK4496050.1 helix-turn-helix transcriptional regulator [Fusobacterium necrophorum]MDK4503551.1 helix-turn-helix transcriptional regulator [Fusobacterium necrophorum]
MLKSKLAYRMLDKDIKSVMELSRQIEISRDTLTKLYNNNRVDTVGLNILDKLCRFFNCQIQDLIEYIPEEQPTEEQS